jgi:hypothetical protein
MKIAKTNSKADILQSGDYDYTAVFGVRVIDYETEEPIGDAIVRLSLSNTAAFEGTTDGTTGIAYLSEVMPGKYTIKITHPLYTTHTETMLLLFPEGYDTLKFDFPLVKKGVDTTRPNPDDSLRYGIRVIVRDCGIYTNPSPPVQNATIQLVTNSGYKLVGITNNIGYVEFANVRNARYHISLINDDQLEGYIEG